MEDHAYSTPNERSELTFQVLEASAQAEAFEIFNPTFVMTPLNLVRRSDLFGSVHFRSRPKYGILSMNVLLMERGRPLLLIGTGRDEQLTSIIP